MFIEESQFRGRRIRPVSTATMHTQTALCGYKRWRVPSHFLRSSLPPLLLPSLLNSKVMSSSSWSTDGSDNEGRGYADGAIASSSLESSSSHSSGSPVREEAANNDVEFNVDNSLEWIGNAPPPIVQGYDWAPHEVNDYPSYFISTNSIVRLLERVDLLSNLRRDAADISLVVCRSNEQACHSREGYTLDFFYAYVTLFRDLGVRLPFSKFHMGVLRELNICPAQLHPNGWAFMQAFVVLCTGLLLTPTPASFLYFFHVRPHPHRCWISLVPAKDKQLFTSFNSSYKDFKSNFIKIAI